MSTVTAVILSAMLTTPIVEVQHDRIVEMPRAKTVHMTQPVASETGIDDAAVSDFVKRAAARYQGL